MVLSNAARSVSIDITGRDCWSSLTCFQRLFFPAIAVLGAVVLTPSRPLLAEPLIEEGYVSDASTKTKYRV